VDLSSINFKSFFSKYLELKKIKDDEYRALCPFHGDLKNPNLTINVQKGIYICFACQEKGNIIDFYKKHTGKTVHDFAVEFKIKHIKYEDYTKFKMTEKISKWLNNRGITEESIKKFKLGYDSWWHGIAIPIFDENGICVNVRKHDTTGKRENDKIISYRTGYGSMKIFNLPALKENKVLMAEGELDCIVLNQNKLPAIAITGGAGSFKQDWIEQYNIKDKEIYIVYDCDTAGVTGSKRIASILGKYNKIKVIDLGLKEKGDITDWFTTYKKTRDELVKLIHDTDYYIPEEIKKDYIETTLSKASREEFYNKSISFKCVVAGKDDFPYQVPKAIELVCYQSNKYERCKNCTLKEGHLKVEFNDKEEVCEFIGSTKDQVLGLVRKKLGIIKCVCAKITEDLKQNIEEIKIIPEIEFTQDESYEYVIAKAYYLGNNIRSNLTYVFFGTTIPDPKNQQVVHVIEKAIPIKNNVEEFKMTNEIKKSLKVFQVSEGQTVEDKIQDIYEDLSHNVTHIYHREDLLMAYDLVYHSVLNFNFAGQRVNKGWAECFILGDAGTGKSETIETLSKHYRAGEIIDAASATEAGLIAGVQQVGGKKWTLLWGAIPLNNKRLIIIEEAKKMSQECIEALTDIRSRGMVKVRKVVPGETECKTRIIMITNPKYRLSEYSYGVLAMKEVIKNQEDMRRFDFAISVVDEEVSSKEINKVHDKKVKHIYTSELCSNRIMFMWSRKRENIIFTEDAEKHILEISIKFAKTYSKVIPLVLAAEMRRKFARLSVAIAGMVNSVDDTGENIIVNKEHVDTVKNYLTKMYNKKGFDYYAYSTQRKKEASISLPSNLTNLISDDTAELLLDNNKITTHLIESSFGVEKDKAREIRNELIKYRAIKNVHTFYIKTPSFINYLKSIKGIDLDNEQEDLDL
jgi:hypothetical protein